MKVKFKNLGPLKGGEIELKFFTIFIGPNNTGKTYLAYSIYSLLWGNKKLFRRSTHNEIKPDLLHLIIKKLEAISESRPLDLSEFYLNNKKDRKSVV